MTDLNQDLNDEQNDAWDDLLGSLSEEDQELIQQKIEAAQESASDDLEDFQASHFSIECDPEAKAYINRLIQNRIENEDLPENSEFDCLILMLKALQS